MTVMPTNASESDHPLTGQAAATAPQPNGLGVLARRITGWTSNLLASAVVLVAGLATGREVIQWWRTDPPSAPAEAWAPVTTLASIADDGQPQILAFGEGRQSVHRESVRGDKRAVVSALRDQCRAVVADGGPAHGEPTAAELQLLVRLADAQPVEQEPGSWQLYELEDALPMIVGVRESARDSSLTRTESAAAPQRRVVAWGLAFPAAEGSWTLFTFCAQTRGDGLSGSSPEIPLPPGGTHTLSIGDHASGSIRAFKGSGPVRDWARFYDDWFHANGWTLSQGWDSTGMVWHARYSTGNPGARSAVDVHFVAESDRSLSGLVSFVPPQQGKDSP